MSGAIITPRLELHHLRPADYEALAIDRRDQRPWSECGITNPYRCLEEPGSPFHYRLPLVRRDAALAPLLLRVAVLREERIIIGHAGFHGAIDADGMIEIGFSVVPEYRDQGYGKEILHGMWQWVCASSSVRTLRYTVSPDNLPSQHIVRALGFTHRGVQIDEEDGPEDIYEMSVEEYRQRHPSLLCP